jgi:hypothetical protein
MLNITIHIIYFIFSLSSEKVLNETQKDQLQLVATSLCWLRDFLKMMQLATGNFKNQCYRNWWSGPLQSSCVQVFLWSIRLDLQTLRMGTMCRCSLIEVIQPCTKSKACPIVQTSLYTLACITIVTFSAVSLYAMPMLGVVHYHPQCCA